MNAIRMSAVLIPALLVFVFTAALVDQRADVADAAPLTAPHAYAHLDTVGGKRVDRGLFDFWSIDPLVPEAWVWAPSSTIAGTGTEYLIMTAAYVPSGPSNPSVTMTKVFDATYDPPTLSAAIGYIVANFAHVSSAADLIVHRQDISLVP